MAYCAIVFTLGSLKEGHESYSKPHQGSIKVNDDTFISWQTITTGFSLLNKQTNGMIFRSILKSVYYHEPRQGPYSKTPSYRIQLVVPIGGHRLSIYSYAHGRPSSVKLG